MAPHMIGSLPQKVRKLGLEIFQLKRYLKIS